MTNAEYYRCLEVGLTTLREVCRESAPHVRDAELSARFVELFDLWNAGPDESPLVVYHPDPLRTLTPGQLVAGCDAVLVQIESEKSRQHEQ